LIDSLEVFTVPQQAVNRLLAEPSLQNRKRLTRDLESILGFANYEAAQFPALELDETPVVPERRNTTRS
jgi:hypothetical protein